MDALFILEGATAWLGGIAQIDNPYEPGTDERFAWLLGWHRQEMGQISSPD